MQALKADGNEMDDHSAIVKYYEKVSEVSFKKPSESAKAEETC